MLLRLYSTGRLKQEDISKLRGHLAFLEHADPALFTRLSFRYFEEIAKLRAKNPAPLSGDPAVPPMPLTLPLAA